MTLRRVALYALLIALSLAFVLAMGAAGAIVSQ